MEASLIKALAPKRLRFTGEPEPLKQYCARIQPLIPNVPRDVIVQWLCRHYQMAMQMWHWLNLPGLHFEKQTWATERLLGEVAVRDPRYVATYRQSLFDTTFPNNSRLALFMRKRGTWPRRIIILDAATLSSSPKMPGPIVLLEGHRRFACLGALSERGMAKPFHRVWFAAEVRPNSP